MEMHQVRYSVAVCDALNFTRAAEYCNVAQPSLTRAIKLLEEELAGPLFNRERNNTHLTELGRLTEPHLRQLLEQARTARRRANAFHELEAAHLKLGLARGLAADPLEATIGLFARRFPETEIMLLDGDVRDLSDALMHGDLELVVLPQQSGQEDDFHVHPIADEAPGVLVRRDHPWAVLDAVPLSDLAAERLIGRRYCAFFESVERSLSARALAMRPPIVSDAGDWLTLLVEAGLGVAITGVGTRSGATQVVRPIADLDVRRRADLATRRGCL